METSLRQDLKGPELVVVIVVLNHQLYCGDPLFDKPGQSTDYTKSSEQS